jgi:hypothetical protein
MNRTVALLSAAALAILALAPARAGARTVDHHRRPAAG